MFISTTIDKRKNEYFVFLLWRHSQKFLLPLLPKLIYVVFCWFYKPARRQKVKKFPKRTRRCQWTNWCFIASINHQRKRSSRTRNPRTNCPRTRNLMTRNLRTRSLRTRSPRKRSLRTRSRKTSKWLSLLLCPYVVFYLDFCKLCNFWDNK